MSQPCLNLALNKLYQLSSNNLVHPRAGIHNIYSTYNAKDKKLKILAVEVLTHLLDTSDLKKKLIIFISNQQSCFFRDLEWAAYGMFILQRCLLRVSPMKQSQTFREQPPKIQRLSGQLWEVVVYKNQTKRGSLSRRGPGTVSLGEVI